METSPDRPLVLFSDFGNDISPAEVTAAVQRARVRHHRNYAGVLANVRDVAPFSIHDGAFHARQLGRVFGWARPVYLGIIDPGVGTDREAVAIETPAGTFVGPNNGIFHLACEEFGINRAVIVDESLRSVPRSKSTTFDGRDLFAPAAALLSAGEHVEHLGDDLPHDRLVDPRFRTGDVLHVCGFGNLKIHAFERVFEQTRRHLAFTLGGVPRTAKKVRTFAEAEDGESVFYRGSSEMCELAMVGANAAHTWGVKPGDHVRHISMECTEDGGTRIAIHQRCAI